MKLVVFTYGGIPITELSEKQKKRFIEMLKNDRYNEDIKLGIELSLNALGYHVKEN